MAKFFNKSKSEIIGKNYYQIRGKEFANTRRLTDNIVRSKNKRIVKEVEWNDRIYKVTKFLVELLDESYGVAASIEEIEGKTHAIFNEEENASEIKKNI